MGLDLDFRTGFYTGVATSDEVPHPFPVSIKGRAYLVDTKLIAEFREASVPLLRAQADDSGEFGEQSLAREELARRSQDSWHLGAGQTHLDRPGSSRERFRSSKGIDVWTKWQMTLLQDTASKRASVNTNLQAIPVGSYVYIADGNEVRHTQSLSGSPTWTDSVIFNGEVAQSVKSITSDGFNIWAALGSNGVHATTRGAVSSSHYSDLSATLVASVKGRLMAAQGASIFNITGAGAAPSATFTQPNTDFSWVGFGAGKKAIYCAGYSGSQSLIYSVTIKADGTGLDTPIQVGALPAGEIVRTIHAYLDHVQIGTDTGVWISPDNHDGLTLNKVLETTQSVRCFVGQGRFVWAGNTNYNSTSTGLWRMDFRTDTGGGSVVTPAYASDLMATGQGTVLSVASFDNKRFFAVSGLGFYYEDANKVSSGTLDSGLITAGLPDLKVAILLDVRHRALAGSHKAYLSADEGSFELVGTHSTAGSTSPGTPFPAGDVSAELFEIREELLRSAADTTSGPAITRHTLMMNPAPKRGETFVVPLLLHESYEVQDRVKHLVPQDEKDRFKAMIKAGVPVSYQQGSVSTKVIPVDYEFRPHNLTKKGSDWNGTLLLKVYAPPLN